MTPGFLDRVIDAVAAAGFEPVDLDVAARRLRAGGGRPFAVFTLDDGYRDNALHAAPVFRRHACPYTIFVPSDFAEGTGELWWLALEESIRPTERMSAQVGQDRFDLATATASAKQRAFDMLYAALRRVDESEQRRAIRRMAEASGVDMLAACRAEMLGWDELRALDSDPLCSIGAHGVRHFALGKLSAEEARAELWIGAERLAERLGRPPRHFAFPYGDATSAGAREFLATREAGFETAVTTRPGVIYDAHAAHMTALPRIALNEAYAAERYADVFLSGAPSLLYNRGRLVP